MTPIRTSRRSGRGRRLSLLLLLCSISVTTLAGEGPSQSRATPVATAVRSEAPATSDQTQFVRAAGNHLVLRGKPYKLQGINFSNYYEMELTPRQLLSSNHHGEEDYRQVASLGLNSVRFAFRGEWYEQDEQTFFNWLDSNISWANRAGVRLILDLHVPIGGFWLDPTSHKLDFSLWDKPEFQQRNLQMWRAITERYRNEPTIAAYDLLNEPVTTDSDGAQWRRFAQRLVKEIRSVDRNHLLIVGKLYGVKSGYTTNNAESQFLVDDDNVMYDIHFYEPIDYTHQYATWIDRPMGDGGKYPDMSVILPTGQQRYITSLMHEHPQRVTLDSTWKRLELARFHVNNPQITAAVPTIIAGELNGATVYFDHLLVTEYNASGQFVRNVIEEPLSRETIWRWWGWHNPAEGRRANFIRVQHNGANDRYSLAISEVHGRAGISGWTSDHLWFRVRQGYSYTISAHLRAERTEQAANKPPPHAYFDLAFYGEPPGNTGFIARDRAYLEQEFMKLYRFAQQHQVPMSVMEFGLMRACFEMEGKGGTQWLSHLLDIFDAHNVSYSYWNYHGERMGLFLTKSGVAPGEPNRDLLTLLQSRLGNNEWKPGGR